MSNALAISAVTATLQYYLTNTYTGATGFASSVVKVTCIAPDQVQNRLTTPDVENQVNLFLHQVTHNAAWRNVDLASLSADGTRRVANPPMALNLHYLLTVYGSEFWQAEALLGYALLMLHENSVITRKAVADALTAIKAGFFPANPLAAFMASTGVADQIEMIKIIPETLGREEMAWLWTALKADYRPTFPFQVSVLLMEPQLPTTTPLPVLRAVFAPQAMKTASISSLIYATNQTAALRGDSVLVVGQNLTGAARVSLTNSRYGKHLSLPVTVQPGGLAFTLPAVGPAYPAGLYDLTVQFLEPGGTFVAQSTNVLPLAVSPEIPTQFAVSAAVPASVNIRVTVTGITPPVSLGQEVTLALSALGAPQVSKTASAQVFPNQATKLDFIFDPGLPVATKLLARLQVDGVTSQVQVDLVPFPPIFKGPWVTL